MVGRSLISSGWARFWAWFWFLLFMAGIESAREASEQPPAREASEQRTAARARRRIRDDINQAGRDDWDDASDE